MAERREFDGKSASPGQGIGPAHLFTFIAGEYVPREGSGEEMEELAKAIDRSVEALSELAARAGGESAEILEFQIEMLTDPSILEMVAERVAAGDGAALAWVGALDDYIERLEDAEDESPRTRAIDVIDIKNRVLGALTGKPVEDFPAGSVYVGTDLAPSLFLAHDWSSGGGIALAKGSEASHVAMLARARGVPMVVATGELEIAEGETLLVDGDAGKVVIDPIESEQPSRERESERDVALQPGPAAPELKAGDGSAIGLHANINDPREIAVIDRGAIDGIGLMRTEFLLSSSAAVADEEKQASLYRLILEWAGEKPVVIRMLDLGGDKQVQGVGGVSGENFMGLRGVRLLLARPELARVQARALLRANVTGNLRVLLPMVALASEVDEIRRIFKLERTYLARRGLTVAMPPIGIMVEVPATALMIDSFHNADFFSFGTNDLAQFLMAAARDNPTVSALHAEAEPAVLRLVRYVMRIARAMGKPVSICGDMAGEPASLPGLLSAGLRNFSVAPSQVGAVRAALAQQTAEHTGQAGG
ncbi:phosphoenolpyruvate--protein phosphotransferase [Rhizobiaceae bacterium n13]|uniref:Phosphoenolpyruvate-protein phosphotransferase n=1 Tax=Ferirhizobium litorale TaxID=2927786 RepID=A0AAE3QEU7_9HYPH|nr:phosphoenolpyruvate--protein phosphotransferase [Fererhizobium litorale]MDI7861754.1 phosphoenolpyruvate--protein phosphotransferase [Fererhizobium litorale]MDI7921904.1 phosphoenolpyruvate--protein phosphotransferase [Fererhizobium litorale]